MPPISRCSNLEITLCCIEEAQQLPIETISDWLNRVIDGRKTDTRIAQEIFMRIYMREIQNVKEMCDHLSKVRFIFMVFLLQFETLFDFLWQYRVIFMVYSFLLLKCVWDLLFHIALF